MTAAVEETGLGQAAGKAATLVRDSVKTVIAASMVGTAIEFYDFYAYGTAAANYFPHIFFSAKDNPTVALLMSLLTFAVAFIARPLGSLIFGHFGDRMGRKTTLVVSLMTMGVGTFLIGCLPTYDQVGVGAVAILCLLRFIQGIGLGGEWSGAALVATENAPEDKRALYGSFPELGAPIGFFLSNGTFFLLEAFNDSEAMMTGAGVCRSCCRPCWWSSARWCACTWRRPRSSAWRRSATRWSSPRWWRCSARAGCRCCRPRSLWP